MIIVNGRIVAQASQFSLNDVEVISAIIDLEEVRSYREQKSRAMQARDQPKYDRIEVDLSLSSEGNGMNLNLHPTVSKDPVYHLPEEEIATGPACYLWDYLRRGNYIYSLDLLDQSPSLTILFSQASRLLSSSQWRHRLLRNCYHHPLDDSTSLSSHPVEYQPPSSERFAYDMR
jgi:hypothetical protein